MSTQNTSVGSVMGRLNSGAGPAQQIKLSDLAAALLQQPLFISALAYAGQAASSGSGSYATQAQLSAVETIAANAAAAAAASIPLTSVGAAGGVEGLDASGNPLNTQTISSLNAAVAASDTDNFITAQGSAILLRQTAANIASYVLAKIPTTPLPVNVIAATHALAATDNGSILVVTTSGITISANFANMGSGFRCKIVNLSSGNITIDKTSITIGNGNTLLAPNHEIEVIAFTYGILNTVYTPGDTVTGPTITVNTIVPQTPNTAIAVSGSYLNDAPSALDYSTNGGTTWTAATSPTISNGTYSFSISAGLAAGTYTIEVRDHSATSVIGTSNSFTIQSASLAITSSASATVGTPLSFTGSVVPTSDTCQVALGVSNTTAPTVNFVSATNTSGTLSGTVTPTSAGLYYLWVKDTTNNTTAVSSTAITVAASTSNATIQSQSGGTTFSIYSAYPLNSSYAHYTGTGGQIPLAFSITPAAANGATVVGFWTSSVPTSLPTTGQVGLDSGDIAPGFYVSGSLISMFISAPSTPGTYYFSLWLQNNGSNNAYMVSSAVTIT
jgi:hypothetical protein